MTPVEAVQPAYTPEQGLETDLAGVLDPFAGTAENLIPMLQAVQREVGYLPEAALREVARRTGLPEASVYGVATFYAQFHLTRQGRHKIRVCQGTACHVRGGKRILKEVRKSLGIDPGETTTDYEFSLERVACLGSCALAPVVVVDQKVHGAMTTAKVKAQLERLGKTSQSGKNSD